MFMVFTVCNDMCLAEISVRMKSESPCWGELGKSSIAIRGAMVDEVKAVDTKGVELKTLDTLAMSWLKRWDKLGFHMGIFFEIFFGM